MILHNTRVLINYINRHLNPVIQTPHLSETHPSHCLCYQSNYHYCSHPVPCHCQRTLILHGSDELMFFQWEGKFRQLLCFDVCSCKDKQHRVNTWTKVLSSALSHNHITNSTLYYLFFHICTVYLFMFSSSKLLDSLQYVHQNLHKRSHYELNRSGSKNLLNFLPCTTKFFFSSNSLQQIPRFLYTDGKNLVGGYDSMIPGRNTPGPSCIFCTTCTITSEIKASW